MADHWKSIANLLGAPGVDEPEDTSSVEAEVKESEQTTVKPAELKRSDEQDSESNSEPPANVLPRRSESSSERDRPKKKSSGFAAALHMDAGDEGVDAGSDDGVPNYSEQEAVAAADSVSDEPPTQSLSKETSVPEPEAESTKPKKKSSWETLARMFNVNIERSAPEPEKPVVVEKPAAAESELSIFRQEEDDANPALEAMFADVPRDKAANWGTKRRVVDDVAWEDDDDVEVPTDESDDESVRGLATEDSSAESEAEAPRRGRRRRRGRGRGNRDENKTKPTDADTRGAEVAWADDADDIDGASDDGPVSWSEPDSFEADDDGEVQEVERRSNRRRRRGRGRTDDRISADSDAGSGENLGDREPRERAKSDVEELPRRQPREDRDSGGSSRRRPRRSDAERDEGGRSDGAKSEPSGRSRSGRPNEVRRDKRPADLPADLPVGFPADEEFDDSLDNGLDDDGDDSPSDHSSRHRSIPTWIDALQPMIDSNTENHRRNEGRGGQRGRPRGRR